MTQSVRFAIAARMLQAAPLRDNSLACFPWRLCEKILTILVAARGRTGLSVVFPALSPVNGYLNSEGPPYFQSNIYGVKKDRTRIVCNTGFGKTNPKIHPKNAPNRNDSWGEIRSKFTRLCSSSTTIKKITGPTTIPTPHPINRIAIFLVMVI